MYVKYLDLSKGEYLEYNNSENSMIKLEKTNIFIGKNNSGKSRLMRQILINEYDKNYYVNDDVEDFIKLVEYIEELLKGMNEYTQNKYRETYLYKEKIRNKIYRNEKDEEILALFICNLLYNEESNNLYNFLQNKKIVKSPYSFSRDTSCSTKYGQPTLKKSIREIYTKIIENKQNVRPSTIFFPSMLSLRKLDNIDIGQASRYHKGLSKMYEENYFSKIKDFNNNIKTGQEIYSDMKKQLLGLSKDRAQFLKYEEYMGENFFNNKSISVFIKDDDNNVYIKEEGEEQYPIFELGDGLQTLVAITYYLFNNDNKPMKVFIDEPEIHLHPGLQRLLISKLQEFDNCQFFISTHSASMIDICDEYDEDISIVCVEKNNGQKTAYNSEYDDMNLYNLIGVRPSSIILSNCTIWVEGPTDIYYIDTFLKLYSRIKNKRNFILGYNYNYAFNGSINIASKIDFNDEESVAMKINKISKSNFIIFDSDNMNKENANYNKIQKIKEKMGKSCYVISKLKTIENIIPPQILCEYFKDNYNSKDKSIKPLVLKFFEAIEKDYGTEKYYLMDFPDTMAEYINKHALKKGLKEYRKYCNNLWKSNKYELAVYFLKKIVDLQKEDQKQLYANIMPDFIKMIEKIYKFIEKNN